MKNKIHTIEVENNEPQSVEKIIEKIRENKIIYVKNKFFEDQEVLDSTTEKKILLLKSHPQLTGKISIKNLTKESFNEQNSAGLQNCSQEEFEELHSLNASYNEKFKFPFIIAVTGLNVTKILEQFRIRVSNNYLEELNEAIFQVHKIAEIRIKQKINLTEK